MHISLHVCQHFNCDFQHFHVRVYDIDIEETANCIADYIRIPTINWLICSPTPGQDDVTIDFVTYYYDHVIIEFVSDATDAGGGFTIDYYIGDDVPTSPSSTTSSSTTTIATTMTPNNGNYSIARTHDCSIWTQYHMNCF